MPDDATQNYHIEGLPFGTRGGMLIKHEFPADAEYVFKITPIAEGNMGQSNAPMGGIKGEQLEVTVDGERVKLFDWDNDMKGFAVRHWHPRRRPIPIKAGLHTVGVTFLATNYAPGNDLNNQFLRTTILSAPIPGFTFYPHVGQVRIDGPFDAHGATDTPSRRKIFVCRPTGREGRRSVRAARSSRRSRSARIRRPATAADVGTLMEFYVAGRNEGGTSISGIERAVRRLLADPEFVYRREARAGQRGAGARATASAISRWPRGCRSSCGAASPTTSC